ncbi:MAG TPA: hypothetical protein DHN29_06005 [Cytophagales bacterium]|nr:hypothetical protein [Cytophagales bacterium]
MHLVPDLDLLVGGSGFLVPRDVFNNVGGYTGDTDFSMRILQEGGTLGYVPHSEYDLHFTERFEEAAIVS